MEARSTSSDLIPATSSDHHRAKQLQSLLIPLGRPAHPYELASRCDSFPASPELVVYLCSIPNSPISLTKDLLVVPWTSIAQNVAEFVSSLDLFYPISTKLWKRNRIGSNFEFELPRKRRLILSFEDEIIENQARLKFQCFSPKIQFDVTKYTERSIRSVQCKWAQKINGFLYNPSLFEKSSFGQMGCSLMSNPRFIEGETCTKDILASGSDPMPMLEYLPIPERDSELQTSFGGRRNSMPVFLSDDLENRNLEERPIMASCNIVDVTHGKEEIEKVNCESNALLSLDKERIDTASKASGSLMQSPKVKSRMKIFHVNATSPRMKQLCESLERDKANERKEKNGSRADRKVLDQRQKLRKKNDNGLQMRERKRSSTSIPPKDQMGQKVLPNFESYVVEEEEGSGGYGTVYRARRKNDGTVVAIKCPHAKAHKHHVYNEQRMLERFGGKSFVIKYEGCIKSGDSDCFVLEHVEHDRPEVLKKEIDLLQLQWYGYCIFRALASLHKQGIVHRDVKPGNFLFSRKVNKGYLIDFNLALDLCQKSGYRNDGKAKEHGDVQINHIRLSNEKSAQNKDRNLPNSRNQETAKSKMTETEKSKMDVKNLRRKALAETNNRSNLNKSQGADGSGITSAERMREPLPCQGRKELLSIVHEARQIQNHEESSSVLSPMRKRIVAPSKVADRALIYPSPMPLVSTGVCLGGSQLINRGNGKSKKEGPCVGTKGFRAPEVLFRSLYQGPKVDIWSAGVSLLYLVIGRTPFFGDPEQNIKDIAKLRGSEDLWEVAKLHNRESSFPKDLYKTDSVPSTKLSDWCETSTKKPDFLKEMPRSLFDLIDKCLTVNPRQRITAEEALKHEFFAPCHKVLTKHQLAQGLKNRSPLHSKSILKPFKVSQAKV